MLGVGANDPGVDLACYDGECEIGISTNSLEPCDTQCGPLRCISASASYQDGGISSGCNTVWEPVGRQLRPPQLYVLLLRPVLVAVREGLAHPMRQRHHSFLRVHAGCTREEPGVADE